MGVCKRLERERVMGDFLWRGLTRREGLIKLARKSFLSHQILEDWVLVTRDGATKPCWLNDFSISS